MLLRPPELAGRSMHYPFQIARKGKIITCRYETNINNIPYGFSIYGHEVRTGKAKVEKWLKGLGW